MESKADIDPNGASIMYMQSNSRVNSVDEPFAKNDWPEESPPPEEIPAPEPKKKRSKKIWKDVSAESSHTKFYKRPTLLPEFKHVTRNEYLSISDTMSGSADTFSCVHGPEGKQYTQKGLLKSNLLKNLDPIPLGKLESDKSSSSSQR